MKKIAITLAIVLGMTICASAQYFGNKGDGLFPKTGGAETGGSGGEGGETEFSGDEDPSSNDGSVGSGALLLVGFGAAYAMAKRNRKE